MNQLDFFCDFYGRLRNYGLPMWVMTPFRRIVRSLANKILPYYLNKNTSLSPKQEDVIVSFTSFPARIDNVWQVVECMMRQTVLPKRVLLWLSHDQFPNIESLPAKLVGRQNDIFEIRFVSGDIRSHKKYLYTCMEYPDSYIILIDDDIYYPSTMIEKMLEERKRSGKVICQYGFMIRTDSKGNIEPYETWNEVYNTIGGDKFFFGSGGGVLFRPSELYGDLTNIDLATKLTPYADDVWLNAMVRLARKESIKIPKGLFLPIIQNSQNITLSSINIKHGNDEQISAINSYYENRIGRKVF